MESDPVAIDLNVDAALLLKDMVGVDSLPSVLVLMPNIYNYADREKVRSVVRDQLVEAGLIVDDRVHPQVAHWFDCLYRPDMELVARITDTGLDGEGKAMLRFSLVRSGDDHVLAMRCDDNIVIQSVFNAGRQLNSVTAALTAALGSYPALPMEPFTATPEQLTDVPSEPLEDFSRALVELGAPRKTALALTRGLSEVARKAEIVMIEHRDGGSTQTQVCVNVLDTAHGRLVATPSWGMDGQLWTTFASGDDAAVHAGVVSLVELLPGRSWFDTVRTE